MDIRMRGDIGRLIVKTTLSLPGSRLSMSGGAWRCLAEVEYVLGRLRRRFQACGSKGSDERVLELHPSIRGI